jgi:hypothetical protein
MNFYCIFIKNYSDLALPLNQLIHKGTAFLWNEQYKQAFQKLKTIFTEALILVRFNPDFKTIIKTDASG